MRKNWNNLKEKKCPLCAYRLERIELNRSDFAHVHAARWDCPNKIDCEGFSIGEKRMEEIVSSMGERSFHAEHDEESNASRLNNL